MDRKDRNQSLNFTVELQGWNKKYQLSHQMIKECESGPARPVPGTTVLHMPLYVTFKNLK